MTFLFDNDISYRLVEHLRVEGVDAKALRQEYTESAKDPEWLPTIDGATTIIITGDCKMRHRAPERAALTQSRATVLFVHKSVMHLIGLPQTLWFLKHWDALQKFLEGAARGSHFIVGLNGRPQELPPL